MSFFCLFSFVNLVLSAHLGVSFEEKSSIESSFIIDNRVEKKFDFYGEARQDEFIYKTFFFKKEEPGIFVDVGSHNGVTHSNSFFFEKELGWNGICIEPNPFLFKELQATRKCKCINVACSNSKGMRNFIFHPCSFVSGLSEFLTSEHKLGFGTEEAIKTGAAKEVLVYCEVLNDIFDQNELTEIDFLSIDTEGADLAILMSIDFEKFNIKVIAVEGIPEMFLDFMLSKGYVSFGRIGNDAIFYKKGSIFSEE